MCSEIQQIGSSGGYYNSAVDGNCSPCYGARRVWVDLEPMELLVARLLIEPTRILLGASSWLLQGSLLRRSVSLLAANTKFKARVIRGSGSERI